jgi:hypothetical protein
VLRTRLGVCGDNVLPVTKSGVQGVEFPKGFGTWLLLREIWLLVSLFGPLFVIKLGVECLTLVIEVRSAGKGAITDLFRHYQKGNNQRQ